MILVLAEVVENSSNVVVDGNDVCYQHVSKVEKHSCISMKRMFLPVGQGALHVERFSVGEHLHEEHINGIPFLMERCHVKRVYLSLISPVVLALMRLDFET